MRRIFFFKKTITLLIKNTAQLGFILFSMAGLSQENPRSIHSPLEHNLPKIYQEDSIIEHSDEALYEALKHKEYLENIAGEMPLVLLPHRPNYLMPFAYTERPYEQPYQELLQDKWPGFNNTEAIFQISVKYQIFQFDEKNEHRLYVAYTNKSYWQVYNGNASRPFRETNHEPELILQLTPNWGYINRINLALNHQSNGQYRQFSRSWNRITAGFYHLDGDSVYGIEPWYRLPEKNSADPEDPTDDDNPDISHYMGYANFIWYRQYGKRSAMLRFGNNLQTNRNKGWIELEWNFPFTQRLRGFVQYYEGYGHSLIEYDQYQRRLGFGVKISDYL